MYKEFIKNPDMFIAVNEPIEFMVGSTIKRGYIKQRYNAQSHPGKIFIIVNDRITSCKFQQILKIKNYVINEQNGCKSR